MFLAPLLLLSLVLVLLLGSEREAGAANLWEIYSLVVSRVGFIIQSNASLGVAFSLNPKPYKVLLVQKGAS